MPVMLYPSQQNLCCFRVCFNRLRLGCILTDLVVNVLNSMITGNRVVTARGRGRGWVEVGEVREMDIYNSVNKRKL